MKRCRPRQSTRSVGRFALLVSIAFVATRAHAQSHESSPTTGTVAEGQASKTAADKPDVDPALADGTIGDQWQAMDLELMVADDVHGCPGHAEVAMTIDQLTGRRFVVAGADVVVRLSVHRAGGERLHVGIGVWEGVAGGGSHTWRRLRDFEQAVPCLELVRAAALSVSLHADLQRAAEKTADTAPPSDGQRAPLPVPSATGPRGGDERAPPSLGETHQFAQTRPPGVPLRQSKRQAREPSTPSMPTLGIGAAPVLSVGQTPGLGVGAELQLGIRNARWAARLGASHLRSTGTTPKPSRPEREVLATATDLWIAGCAVFSGARYRACAVAGHLWLHAQGRGFYVNRQQLLGTPWVGAQLGAAWPLTGRFAAGPRLDVLLPLRPVELRVVGEEEPFWEMSPVAVRLALELFWH